MKKLKLGVAREIITPPVGTRLYGYSPDIYSTSVNDDLTVTAFCFVQGEIGALLLSITVCEIRTSLCDSIRELLSKETGVPKENIMLCATHTHSGPDVAGTEGWGSIDNEYVDTVLVPKLVKASKTACENLKNVKCVLRQGESRVGINRRQLFFDNRVDFGQNPYGCVNLTMSIVSFEDEGSKTVANIVHYGCHGTCAGPNTEITRDWSGLMTDALEKESGGVTAFVNGTMGDVGPRISNGKTTGDISYVYELGEIAARDVLAIFKGKGTYSDNTLSVGENVIGIDLKDRMCLVDAETMYEKYKDKNVNLDGLMKSHLEEVIGLEKQGVPSEKQFEIRQSVLCVGDVVLTGIPFEMFSETGFRICEAVTDKRVLCISNTNGFEGYFATEDALCRGGYEVSMYLYSRPQKFCDNADWYLMKQMTEGIEKITDR